MAHATGAAEFVGNEWSSLAEAKFELHGAIRACCSDEIFTNSVQEIRASLEVDLQDPLLSVLPMISRFPEHVASEILMSVHGELEQSADRTQFGLMNAVTAVARETRNADLRWKLEVIGGAIPSLDLEGQHAVARLSDEYDEAGHFAQ